MRRLLVLLLLVGAVACEQTLPAQPSTNDENAATNSTNVNINIFGDDDGKEEDSANRPPQITSPGTQQSVAGDAVALQIPVFDPDGDEVSCTMANAPRGLSISPSCLITGEITASSPSDAPFTTSVIATDSRRASSLVTFTWNVAESEV